MNIDCLNCHETLFEEELKDIRDYETRYQPYVTNVEIMNIFYGHHYDCTDSSSFTMQYKCKKCDTEGTIQMDAGGQDNPSYKRT